MVEQTLSIIKPDAVRSGNTADIIAMIKNNGFKIIKQKTLLLSKEQAENFYYVHKSRPFFNELTDFMISGPIVVQILEKENAVLDNRKLMGATNPKEADKNTIRHIYGKSIEENAVHGSDSLENAKFEINFFFKEKINK